MAMGPFMKIMAYARRLGAMLWGLGLHAKLDPRLCPRQLATLASLGVAPKPQRGWEIEANPGQRTRAIWPRGAGVSP